MMIHAQDAVDIGRVLAWAARPREVPARHEDYHRIVVRYRQEPEFAAAVDSVLAGAGLYLEADDRDGLIMMANADSPLRVTASDVVKKAPAYQRSVIGAAILAIARTAYPEGSMIDDPDRLAVFTTQSVVDTLDRVAQQHADRAGDGDADDELAEAWRQWEGLADSRANAKRRSTSDKAGFANRVCKILTEAGYLTARGETDNGTWVARPRFRHAVRTLCEESELYAQINGLAMQPAAREADE